jgi:hypothetical protein
MARGSVGNIQVGGIHPNTASGAVFEKIGPVTAGLAVCCALAARSIASKTIAAIVGARIPVSFMAVTPALIDKEARRTIHSITSSARS